MIPTHSPAHVDVQSILRDLNSWGIKDYKIEAICGFSPHYVGQLKCGNIRRISFEYGARLHNFWVDEWLIRNNGQQMPSLSPASN